MEPRTIRLLAFLTLIIICIGIFLYRQTPTGIITNIPSVPTSVSTSTALNKLPYGWDMEGENEPKHTISGKICGGCTLAHQ